MIAALSGDEMLLEAFAAGQDVHAATAREVLGKNQQVCVSRREYLVFPAIVGIRSTTVSILWSGKERVDGVAESLFREKFSQQDHVVCCRTS